MNDEEGFGSCKGSGLHRNGGQWRFMMYSLEIRPTKPELLHWFYIRGMQ